MELFGLKSKEGHDYVLVVPPLAKANDVFAFRVEPKQEFKVGDWIHYDVSMIIFYCIRIDGEFLISNDGVRHHVIYCRLATPQEIKKNK